VSVGVTVGVLVGVAVGVSVGVLVGVSVGVAVAVCVGVAVGVWVGVEVGVRDGVEVGVRVGVDVAGLHVAMADALVQVPSPPIVEATPAHPSPVHAGGQSGVPPDTPTQKTEVAQGCVHTQHCAASVRAAPSRTSRAMNATK
jgi:hypothetical protein